ncbi:DNA adenine methylase [Candidatus Pacearchaeota archaeon]|jgi:adenine-specific DNA-methyltransferase|nr:DNA adenine methylase [Candidatus Pacearchaeota archaeon]
MQLSPFENEIITDVPSTEGIKYTGSKLKLLKHILTLANKVKSKTIFDGFSGSTRVSQAFAQSKFTVIANDISTYSFYFANCYLKNIQPKSYFIPIIDHLNNLPGVDGWFTENYGGYANGNGGKCLSKDELKKPWQIHNTMKLDAIREEIDKLNLPFTEKTVLITSLILAMDKVDSTLGHFAAYLKEWSPRSYKTMRLTCPNIWVNDIDHRVFQGDIFSILDKVNCDLAYFDPPYGSNNEKMPPSRVRYQAYYHLWTTICLNDKPKIFGKAKRREDTSDTISASIFEEFRKSQTGKFLVIEAIEKLIKNIDSQFVILSYSSGGRATLEELIQVLSESGKIIEIEKIDFKKNVMANMRWTNDWIKEIEEPNKEFLFLLEKN